MPFTLHFCSPCLLPAESSIHSPIPSRSSSTIKSLLRRHFLKKHSTVVQQHSHQVHHQQLSTRKFQHMKGSNIVLEVNPSDKSHPISKTSNNYDMTILHDDELNNTHLATRRRRKKKIPSWAQKDQLELAIINQVYFQDTNPEDIFGDVRMDHVFDMIDSIGINSRAVTRMIVSCQRI